MHANTSCAALDAAHLSPTARGVIATPANAAGTAAAPIVSLYDLDTSSYDIDPDGRTVHIYGAAFFRTAPRDAVRFTLVLSRADLRDDEAPAWINFDSDDLEAAGLALADARRARLRFPLLDFRVARRPTAEKLPDIYRW